MYGYKTNNNNKIKHHVCEWTNERNIKYENLKFPSPTTKNATMIHPTTGTKHSHYFASCNP